MPGNIPNNWSAPALLIGTWGPRRPLVHMVDIVSDQVMTMEVLRAGRPGVIREQLLQMTRTFHARSEPFTTWAEPWIAARLDVQPGSTLVVFGEIVFTARDRPVEFS